MGNVECTRRIWLSRKLIFKGLTFKLLHVVYTWNLNTIQQKCASFWRFSSQIKASDFWGNSLFFHTKSWFHPAPKNRNPETLYKIKCDVGASKNAGQAFSTPRLSSHFILYKVSGFRLFNPSNQDLLSMIFGFQNAESFSFFWLF